jgi:hypothetical protein
MHEWPPVPDRRKRARVSLRWQITLSRGADTPAIRTETKDVSSHGFYCVTPEPVTPGEHLDCVMTIPVPVCRRSEEVLRLHCQVRVARVSPVDGQQYGLGCSIEDYSVVHGSTHTLAPVVTV